MDRYQDQRILNTKQCFYSALFSLIQDKPYVSVLDVCRQANRTNMTFYHHYSNIDELMQEAINDQLSLRLPIPVKLKPRNLKQFVYYLIKFLEEFGNYHTKLLMCVIKNTIDKFIKNTYLDLLIKTINYHVNKELSNMYGYEQPITINIWSDVLTYGLIGLFFKRMMTKKSTEFETIKTNLNLFANKYSSLN